MQIHRMLALMLLACSSVAAANGVYKWTDEQGKVHYSDVPPPNEADRLKLTTPGGVTPVDPASARNAGVRSTPSNQSQGNTKTRQCDILARELARVEASPSGKALKTDEERVARA